MTIMYLAPRDVGGLRGRPCAEFNGGAATEGRPYSSFHEDRTYIVADVLRGGTSRRTSRATAGSHFEVAEGGSGCGSELESSGEYSL